jgi:LysR family cys regulon transcriptional activator
MKLQQLYKCRGRTRGHLGGRAPRPQRVGHGAGLYTSQPGISKQIRLLEDELGVEIFARSGKHLTHVTPAGQVILEAAGEVLRKVESIKHVAQEYSDEKRGALSIATTHTQARYVLPDVIQGFIAEATPRCPCTCTRARRCRSPRWRPTAPSTFAIATEALELFSDLVMMPCYRWNRCVLVPRDHPADPGVEADPRGRRGAPDRDLRIRLHGPLAPRRGLRQSRPDAAGRVHGGRRGRDQDLRAPRPRYRHHRRHGPRRRDDDLVALDARHLFASSVTSIGCRKGTFLRGYMYDFIEDFRPAPRSRPGQARRSSARPAASLKPCSRISFCPSTRGFSPLDPPGLAGGVRPCA